MANPVGLGNNSNGVLKRLPPLSQCVSGWNAHCERVAFIVCPITSSYSALNVGYKALALTEPNSYVGVTGLERLAVKLRNALTPHSESSTSNYGVGFNWSFTISVSSQVKVMSNQASTLGKPMRDLTLSEVHSVVQYLQGELLTFIEAVYPEGSQRKAVKDTVNRQVSRALSRAQDIAWGREDSHSDVPEQTEA